MFPRIIIRLETLLELLATVRSCIVGAWKFFFASNLEFRVKLVQQAIIIVIFVSKNLDSFNTYFNAVTIISVVYFGIVEVS